VAAVRAVSEKGGMEMERIDRILRHEVFLENLRLNREAEEDRPFCRHDMAHFLDVARIGRILNLEEGLGIEEEMIYAAALLHDIGRHLQYSRGIPHEQASAGIAPEILADCGFGEEETAVIVDAILCHRGSAAESRQDSGKGRPALRSVLYRADKAGRPCFCCEAREECSWGEEKKNLELRY